jgi:RNA polymerase sigma factor (sigma-70 family)
MEGVYPIVVKIIQRRMSASLLKWLEPEDVAQESLITALRLLPRSRVRTGADFLAWLLSIARNQIRFEVRRSRKRKYFGILTAMQEAALPARQQAEQRRALERILALACALDGLTDHQREAVVLRNWFELSWGKVAFTLSRSTQGAVRVLYHRSKAVLGANEALYSPRWRSWETSPQS